MKDLALHRIMCELSFLGAYLGGRSPCVSFPSDPSGHSGRAEVSIQPASVSQISLEKGERDRLERAGEGTELC